MTSRFQDKNEREVISAIEIWLGQNLKYSMKRQSKTKMARGDLDSQNIVETLLTEAHASLSRLKSELLEISGSKNPRSKLSSKK